MPWECWARSDNLNLYCSYVQCVNFTKNLIVVDMHNRSTVYLPSVNDVVDRTDNSDAAKHDDSVVHKLDWWVVEQWEEAHDSLLNAVENRHNVDWDAL